MHHRIDDQGGLPPGGGLHPGSSIREGLHPGGSASREGLHPGVLGRPPRDTWDTMVYGQQAGSVHPT